MVYKTQEDLMEDIIMTKEKIPTELLINRAVVNRLKGEVVLMDKKLKDCAEIMKIDYNKFSLIINGFQSLPSDFVTKLDTIISTWRHDGSR